MKSFIYCALSLVLLQSISLGQSSENSDWIQWGGANRDFQVNAEAVPDSIKLNEIWRRELGEGYSAILVEGDKLFTMYRKADEEFVVCMNQMTGDTIWEYGYLAATKKDATTSYGKGPKSTPMIVGESIVSIGFNGDIRCLDKKSGSVRWKSNLIDELGGTNVGMGYSQSPIAYDGQLLLPLGGDGKGIAALSLEDGSIVWSAQDLANSYSTPVMATVDGMDQIILVMTDEVVSVNPKNGEKLWTFPLTNQWSTHAFVPVWNAETQTLFVSSFRQSHALKLSRNGDQIEFEKRWSIPSAGVGFTNAVVVDGVVIGSTGGSRSPLVTGIDLETGKVLWRERGFGVCNYVAIGDRVMLLDENGKFAIARPTQDALNVLQQEQVLNAPKAWTVPTVANGKLYMRDQKEVVVYDLK